MCERKWDLQLEHKLECGRPDIIFRQDSNTLVVVEIKRDDNDDPVAQLKRYIRELRKTTKYRRFRGLIICGRRMPESHSEARKAGFEVLEFRLSLKFPRMAQYPRTCVCALSTDTTIY